MIRIWPGDTAVYARTDLSFGKRRRGNNPSHINLLISLLLNYTYGMYILGNLKTMKSLPKLFTRLVSSVANSPSGTTSNILGHRHCHWRLMTPLNYTNDTGLLATRIRRQVRESGRRHGFCTRFHLHSTLETHSRWSNLAMHEITCKKTLLLVSKNKNWNIANIEETLFAYGETKKKTVYSSKNSIRWPGSNKKPWPTYTQWKIFCLA
jgi:hypothetical protein